MRNRIDNHTKKKGSIKLLGYQCKVLESFLHQERDIGYMHGKKSQQTDVRVRRQFHCILMHLPAVLGTVFPKRPMTIRPESQKN